MKQFCKFLIVVMPLLYLNGCGGTSGNGAPVATGQPTFVADFDPNQQVIPFPDDLLFTGSTNGKLNIPVVNPNDVGDPKVAMNDLDGFSTIAPISTTFSIAADPATLIPGTTLHLYEVTALATGAVTGITRELTAQEYKASLSAGNTLVIQPQQPLKSNTRYLVVLTSGIKSTTGLPLVPSSIFGMIKGTAPLVDANGNSQFVLLSNAQAQQLDPLRKITQTYLAAANGAGVPAAAVALAWTFKTQTINNVLAAIWADSVIPGKAKALNFSPLQAVSMANFLLSPKGAKLKAFVTPQFNPFAKIGSVIFGNIKAPYYLSSQGGMGVGGAIGVAPTVPPKAITSHFQFPLNAQGAPSALPKTISLQPINFIMTTPAQPGPWPVVIFQHGFTADKTNIFFIANSLSAAGFAVIAIDSVLHGERTFNLDLVTQAVDPVTGNLGVTAPVPDGVPDSSGQWYLNLSYLLTFRDNIRQSVADLIHLTRLLEVQTMDLVNNTTGLPLAAGALPDGPDLVVSAAQPISYVGHSNGGILGTMLAAVEPSIKTFVLANPGGIYSNIALHSTEISPKVLAGLASKGITPTGTPKQFNAFFVAAQTVLDDGDPINYGGIAKNTGKNILMFKQLNDAVVPNTSTDALAAAFGMVQVANNPAAASWPISKPSPFIGSGFTFFIQGTHSSFLDPTINMDVTTEMQTETFLYLTSGLPYTPNKQATVTISGAGLTPGVTLTQIMQ